MDRRKYLLGTVGVGMALAGCLGSGPADTEDEVIDANAEEIIVRLDDLDSGWSGGLEEDENSDANAVYLNEDVTVEITVDEYSDIESAEAGYDELESEETESASSDSLDYGNEGFLVNPAEGLIIMGFRAGNFVFKIESFTTEGSTTNPEDPARDMADIIVDKIADIQDS